KKKIYGQHFKSLIAPGTTVGNIAGEAVGSSTTQTTLNTFHTAGSSRSVSSGIEGIKELIYAKLTRKNETCTVYFKNRNLSLREVFDKRSDIVGSVVSDFILKYEILKRKTK